MFLRPSRRHIMDLTQNLLQPNLQEVHQTDFAQNQDLIFLRYLNLLIKKRENWSDLADKEEELN